MSIYATTKENKSKQLQSLMKRNRDLDFSVDSGGAQATT